MRDCNLFPGMALSCKETFSLYYNEDDQPMRGAPLNSIAMMEAPKVDNFKLIDRIASDEGRFTSNSEVIINTEVRSIPITKRGVHFAFRDQGACLSLISIKIYYIVCPSVINNLAVFPQTPTGQELTSFVTATGNCVPNASPIADDVTASSVPKLICKGDGNWTLPSGGCRCNDGFEAVGNSCKEIPGWKRPNKMLDSSVLAQSPQKNQSFASPASPASTGFSLPERKSPTSSSSSSRGREYFWVAGITAGILAVLGVVMFGIFFVKKR